MNRQLTMVIHNEAWYRREKAFVEMSWEKIRAMLGNALRENSEALFRIKDGQGNPVRFQIDQVDPYDRPCHHSYLSHKEMPRILMLPV